MSFYRLMGSGKGMGFHPFPDWEVYCLLQVWDSESYALKFFKNSTLISKYRSNAKKIWTVYMKNLTAHGNWSGSNPFQVSRPEEDNKVLAVITRARIRPRLLLKFWNYVPESQKPLEGNPGLIFTKGIGEIPILNMATFSIWKDAQSLKHFAYHSEEHKKAIQKTQELGWYSEELFSRFQPYRTEGSWDNLNLKLNQTP